MLNKKTIAATIAAAAMIALSACASVSTGLTEPVVASATATPSANSEPAPVLTAAPTPDAEDQLLDATHKIPGLEGVSKTDASRVGHYVCTQLDSGVAPADITAVADTDPMNNADMIMISVLLLCPAHTDPAQQNVYDKRHEAAGQ